MTIGKRFAMGLRQESSELQESTMKTETDNALNGKGPGVGQLYWDKNYQKYIKEYAAKMRELKRQASGKNTEEPPC